MKFFHFPRRKADFVGLHRTKLASEHLVNAISDHQMTPKTRPLTVADRLPETGDILIDPYLFKCARYPSQFSERCPYFGYMTAFYERVVPRGYVYLSRADGGCVTVPIDVFINGEVMA